MGRSPGKLGYRDHFISPTRRTSLQAAFFSSLLASAALGCSSEPQVIYKEVPVEVIKEVEIVREVVVTATPEPTRAVPTSTPEPIRVVSTPTLEGPTPTPTPAPKKRAVLVVDTYIDDHKQMKALGFTESIDVELYETDRVRHANGPSTLDAVEKAVTIRNYGGVLVTGRPTYELMKQVRRFVEAGGRAAIATNCKANLQEYLQALYEISCADSTFTLKAEVIR